jgi:hypothetical protein
VAKFVYVLSHDIVWATKNNPKPLTQPLDAEKDDSKVYEVGGKDKVSDVVNTIATLAGAGKVMTILRICAHGRPGLVSLGSSALLYQATVGEFHKLKGLFHRDGRIELHSCFAAGSAWDQDPNKGVDQATSTGTAEWVRTLATLTNVPVWASNDKQVAEPSWEFEKSKRVVVPGSSASQPARGWDDWLPGYDYSSNRASRHPADY